MNLDNALNRDDYDHDINLRQRILNWVAIVLNQILSAIGVLLFGILMMALLTSPAWVPALVNGVIFR